MSSTRSSHFLLIENDEDKHKFATFDKFVMFVREHIHELKSSSPPCFVGQDKINSVSWYLVMLSKDSDDAFAALYSYILSNDENILKSRFERDPEIIYYLQRDAALIQAMKEVTDTYKSTRMFMKQSAAPLQTFKQMVQKLFDAALKEQEERKRQMRRAAF